LNDDACFTFFWASFQKEMKRIIQNYFEIVDLVVQQKIKPHSKWSLLFYSLTSF